MKHIKHIIAAALALALTAALIPPAAMASEPEVTLSEEYLYAASVDRWYTEESYWASPVVTDLDGDGSLEIINASYSLFVVDAATGTEKWRVNSGCDRSSAYVNYAGNTAGQVFTDFEVLDIDGDGRKEIIVAYANGTVSVLSDQGYFKPGWPQRPTSAGIRSLAVADLDGDGLQEIIVGAGISDAVSVWVYRCDGSLAPNWPQLDPSQNAFNYGKDGWLSGNTAYSYGVFGDGIATGDLDGDGLPEIIVPTDQQFVVAYHYDGSLVRASSTFEGRSWGQIAFFEDYETELSFPNEGWTFIGTEWQPDPITRADSYRAEFGHSKAVYTDVDGDGKAEVVITALMTDCTTHSLTNWQYLSDTRYMSFYILNQDRTRYVNQALGFDWSTIPNELNSALGGPLMQQDPESMAGGVLAEPVCADLDGDGLQEILINTYDGKLHCFSLDGTEHGSWPFTMPKTSASVYEFATPPVCVDINGDGTKEVIFASWTTNEAKGFTGVNGALYIASSNGQLLASIDLHDSYESLYQDPESCDNGVYGSPVVYDIDNDGKYEVLLNTTTYGLCAYQINVNGSSAPAPAPAPTAYASTQYYMVDGAPVEFQSYALLDENGNPTNYVKLRDVAYVLNGSAAQFDILFDGAVNVVTRTPYDHPNGSEMYTPFSGNRSYINAGSPTRVNGTPANMEAIILTDDNGGQYTYYKLRDLGAALGFNVAWSNELGAAIIETDKPYSG